MQKDSAASLLLVLLVPTVAASGEAGGLDIDRVLAKAVERARLNEEMANDARYVYRFATKTEVLGKNGEVESVEERTYEAVLLDGFVYERLVEIDGRPLTGAELAREKEREQKFRKKVAEGEADPMTGKARRSNDEDRLTFDEALVSRYEISFLKSREIDGRNCHELSFVPKSAPLPAGGRFDELLNNAAGTLCIDAETFEIVNLEFELQEKVNFWWGLLGSVSAMTGELERRPVDSGVWLPQSFELYLKGRKLFLPFRLRESFEWRDYARSDLADDGRSAIRTAARSSP